MNLNTFFLKVFAALVVLFYLPVGLLRFGPKGALRRARAVFSEVTNDTPGTAPDIYLIETHDQATVEGDVRMDLHGVHGSCGMLAVVHATWEGRPDKVNQLVFWVSESDSIPAALTSEAVYSSLGLEHSPRPVAGAEKYINGLVVSDSVRERIRSMLDLACTYTGDPDIMRA